jgi:hypothetical protein
VSSTTALDAALATLNDFRPDPKAGEIENLISAGNSFYKGVTVELRKRVMTVNDGGWKVLFRAGYTLSSLIDDGVVNTSDALTPGDFRHERARSLLDRRHRFVFSGTVGVPRWLGFLQFSPFLRIASSAPFNISLGGVDRNLDDVSNDRPNFSGDIRSCAGFHLVNRLIRMLSISFRCRQLAQLETCLEMPGEVLACLRLI